MHIAIKVEGKAEITIVRMKPGSERVSSRQSFLESVRHHRSAKDGPLNRLYGPNLRAGVEIGSCVPAVPHLNSVLGLHHQGDVSSVRKAAFSRGAKQVLNSEVDDTVMIQVDCVPLMSMNRLIYRCVDNFRRSRGIKCQQADASTRGPDRVKIESAMELGRQVGRRPNTIAGSRHQILLFLSHCEYFFALYRQALTRRPPLHRVRQNLPLA